MAVNVKIKQEKRLFKKMLNVWDIIEIWNNCCVNSYGNQSVGLLGIQDEWFRIDGDFLNPTKENSFIRMNKIKKFNNFILFDRLNLNRGIILSFEKNDILLSLSYPSTLSEITNFYSLIQNICKKIGNNTFIREDSNGIQNMNLDEIEKYINSDYLNSYQFLNNIYNGNEDETFTFFTIMNPIGIDKKIINNFGMSSINKDNSSINNVMFKFENYLNNLQQTDRFYTIPNCFKKDDKSIICVYSCPPECETIVTIDPEYDFRFYKLSNSQFNNINAVSKYYAIIGYNGKMYQIEYKALIEKLNNYNYYDSNHIIINYTDDDIKDLIETCNVEEL